MFEGLRNTMQCPVCLTIPRIVTDYGLFKQCVNGHLICFPCLNSLRNQHPGRIINCVICRGDYSQVRPLIAEQIVADLPHRCENELHGCTTLAMDNELRDHEAVCQFRWVACPECKENAIWIITEAIEHIEKHSPVKHFDKYYEGSWDVPFCENNGQWIHIEAYGRHFFPACRLWRDPEENEGDFWVNFLGSPREAKQFSFQYKVYYPGTDTANRDTCSYMGPVKILEEAWTHDVDFDVKMEYIDQFIVDKKLYFSVEIIKNY
jgi:hypothetical protein